MKQEYTTSHLMNMSERKSVRSLLVSNFVLKNYGIRWFEMFLKVDNNFYHNFRDLALVFSSCIKISSISVEKSSKIGRI